MAKRKLSEKLELFLSFLGYEKKESTSRKYITMQKEDKKYFIGKHGALRTGKNPSNSFSLEFNPTWEVIITKLKTLED